MTEGTLVPSPVQGRYAIGDPQFGRDITSGTVLAIELGGQWIQGSVEYASKLYTNMGPQDLFDPLPKPAVLDGYYFTALDGTRCGLCVGMRVRIP